MRVGIIGLLHESNTFIQQPTTIDDFRQNTLVTGPLVRERFAGTHHEIGGFFAGLEAAGMDAVGLMAARALPFGTITASAFDALLQTMISEIDRSGPLDGFLVAPHGATVSERYPDADGHWLATLRARVGSKIPIVGTLDPHANLSAAMVASCNALTAYRTNPHLDQKARGLEAAELLVRTLRGQIHPAMAAQFPPMAINIEKQCTQEAPCDALCRLAENIRGRRNVLTASVLLGFPYADVPEMGSAFLVVTDNDMSQANELAAELATHAWTHRDDFAGTFTTISDAVQSAINQPGPVCLLDMGDNVGGGSPGDGTYLAHELNGNSGLASFVCLYDPEAVSRAIQAAPGRVITMAVGGKCDNLHGSPLKEQFTVVGLFDGKFEEPEVRHGGFQKCDQGPTAIVRAPSGLTIMLTSLRMPPFSLRQLTTFGVQPSDFQVLVAKGVNAPVAAYQPVCRRLIRVDTPGVTSADMRRLQYLHRRTPMFPFEPDFEWRAT